MTYEEVTVSMFGSGAKKGLNMQEIDDGDHPWKKKWRKQWRMGEPSDHDAGFTPVEERGREFE